MTKEQLQILVQMIGNRLDTEKWLFPTPIIYMQEPYDILDWLKNEKLATPEELDQWLVEGQTNNH